MPTKSDILQAINVQNDLIKREHLGDTSPLSPPILIPGPTRQIVLNKLSAIPQKEREGYNFFVFGKAAKSNFIQIAAPDESVKRFENHMSSIDGIAFVNTGDKATRAFFDFDCPVFDNETVEEKSKQLHDWIVGSFWPAVLKFCDVPKKYGRRFVMSTKHRKKKASFHLVSADVLAVDSRVWAYKMKDFWRHHKDDLLKESWAFMGMGPKSCPNKNANGVEDGAPRGREDGSPIHQWVEHGRHRHQMYTLSAQNKVQKTEECTAWDAHPQRIIDDRDAPFFIKADSNRFGTSTRKRRAEQDQETRMNKFVRMSTSSDVSTSSVISNSADSVQTSGAVWDAYPTYSAMIKLAFEEISTRTGCSIHDMKLRPFQGPDGKQSFVVGYRATDKAKECQLVEGHRHTKNHAKFTIFFTPFFTLLGGCHSLNHPAGTPKWKKILEFTSAPVDPPGTPTAEIDLGTENANAHMVCVSVPSTQPFRLRFGVGARRVDITNKTQNHDYFSVRVGGKMPRLAKPSCVIVDAFINGQGARNLVKRYYFLSDEPLSNLN